EYTFSTSTTDPEEDQIYYLFDWGDGESSGWLGPYNSGDAIQATHVWTDAGDYEIQVKAKDTNDRESDWSDSHSIHILKTPYTKVEQIYGGFFKVNAVIRNLGEIEATNIQWSITLDGGIILGRETTGTIPNIPPGGNVTVNSNLILGFGEITVTAKAEITENTHEKTNNGFAYFLYIKVNPSGSI
ncbi:MAG: PKD domain-containing protein, partial [Thermoplasmatales archaeon]|nr:PKD domain-containing protein [Thermoplasmatales archaeon]